jgi:hypothetical protein
MIKKMIAASFFLCFATIIFPGSFSNKKNTGLDDYKITLSKGDPIITATIQEEKSSTTVSHFNVDNSQLSLFAKKINSRAKTPYKLTSLKKIEILEDPAKPNLNDMSAQDDPSVTYTSLRVTLQSGATEEILVNRTTTISGYQKHAEDNLSMWLLREIKSITFDDSIAFFEKTKKKPSAKIKHVTQDAKDEPNRKP